MLESGLRSKTARHFSPYSFEVKEDEVGQMLSTEWRYQPTTSQTTYNPVNNSGMPKPSYFNILNQMNEFLDLQDPQTPNLTLPKAEQCALLNTVPLIHPRVAWDGVEKANRGGGGRDKAIEASW